MSLLPGRLLKEGWIIFYAKDQTLERITNVDYVLPGNRVALDVEDQMTGETSTRGVGWEDRVFVYEPTQLEIDSSQGTVGTLTIEPAGVPDDEDRITYRWRLHDGDGNELDSRADTRSEAGGQYDPIKAMVNLLGFLGAAAEAREGSENWDLFSDAVRDWATTYSTELQVAELELSPELGVEQ